MKGNNNEFSRTYNGYLILICGAAMLLVLAGIFTYYIRTFVQCISALMFFAFFMGFTGVRYHMKQEGLQRMKGLLFLLRLLPTMALPWILLQQISPVIKSILTGILLGNMLDAIKPKERKQEK